MAPNQRLLVEYKPFEPAFYHTDIADWGMAVHLGAGPVRRRACWWIRAITINAQNIEQIVAWLLHTNCWGIPLQRPALCGRRSDAGSIDPYQIFRIFHEIHAATDDGWRSDIAYMIDQSHNLKGKIEAMVQTVVTAQELYLKAALVDREAAGGAAAGCDLVAAEDCIAARSGGCAAIDAGVARGARIACDPGRAERERLCGTRARERGSRSMAVSSYA